MTCICKGNFNNLDKLPFEDVNNKLCKVILGVGKRSNNLAARAELGRFPLFISIIVLTLKYVLNVMSSPNKLSYQAYLEESNSSALGQKNLVTFCHAVLHQCKLTWPSITGQKTENQKFLNQVRTTLQTKYSEFFFDRLNSTTGQNGTGGNQLRTYRLIKSQYSPEPYTEHNLSPKCVSIIAKLRISAHDLSIEKGRRANSIKHEILSYL